MTDPRPGPAASLERCIADLSAMIAIPSMTPWTDPPRPGYRETEMAKWLLDAMAGLGLETGSMEVLPDRPNIWGYRRGTGDGPTLMLCAHMDTVRVEGYRGDPFRPVVEDGRLYGRGACDMKGAIAAFLEAVRLLRHDTLAGDLLLLFVIDEEFEMAGSVMAGEAGPTADWAIVGEPTELAICPAHKGGYILEITVEGVAAHTSQPELGRSAILDAHAIITELDGLARELRQRKGHALCGQGRLTVARIEGGEGPGTVPDRCRITVQRRTLPDEDKGVVDGEIQACIDRATRRRPGLRASFVGDEFFGWSLDTVLHNPLVRAGLAAAGRISAGPVSPKAFPGGTDAPNLKIPAIICGPGDLAQAHTASEWIEVRQMPMAARLYAEIARSLLA